MNLLTRFVENADRHPLRTAIIDADGRKISYAELLQISARLAASWRGKGVGAGDRVLLAMPVGIDLYAAIAGLWQLGATIVFPEPAMGYKGLRHAVTMTAPKALLTDGWYRLLRIASHELWRIPINLHITPSDSGKIEPLDVASDHPALISFTSGSTGLPKGIVRSHTFMAEQDACIGDFLKPMREHETDLVAFPIFVIANLGLGITSVLPNWKLKHHDKASPEAIVDWVEQNEITRALVPPSICEIMARGPDMPGLRDIFTGGGPVFPDLLERLAKRLPNVDTYTVYGSTEAEPIAWLKTSNISSKDWSGMREGRGLLAGKPLEQIDLQLVKGEILIAGDHVNKGYLDGKGDSENKVSKEDKIWHRTGDAGRLDEQGRLWLLGRHGAKAGDIYPFMAEAAARYWPGVRQAALLPGLEPATLVIEGDKDHLPEWNRLAGSSGGFEVLQIDEIPMDSRHHSKIDHKRLKKKL